MNTFSDTLQIAIKTAKGASEIALKYFQQNIELGITTKSDNSLVTRADIEVERYIKETILAEIPTANFILEESKNSDKQFNDIWIVDPIDGTREFVRGIEQWGTLIAHAVDGIVIEGVAYFPVQDKLFCAENGKGAYTNGERVHVSKIVKRSEAVISFAPMNYFVGDERKGMLNVLDEFGTARGTGTILGGSNVASGKFDGFIASRHNHIWDNAAFIPIVEEAGGRVSDWNGHDINLWELESPAVMSNGLLHEEIIKTLNA